MRFYGGGDPLRWLHQPLCLLRGVAAQIPRLEAEENLKAMTTTAIGTGSIKADESMSIQRVWNHLAAGPDAVATPKKPRFNLGGLAAAGVKVEKVPAK